MAESRISIWNKALGWIGTRIVASEQENTQEAIQCRLYWDSARRQVLRDFPWNFAQRRASLAEIPLPDGWEGEYTHAYALPDDCIQVRAAISPCMGRLPGRQSRHYRIVLDKASNRKALLTNIPAAILEYTADVADTILFDDSFMHLLTRKLAALIAVPLLKNNPPKVNELELLYQAAIPPARQANTEEEYTRPAPDSWLAIRG